MSIGFDISVFAVCADVPGVTRNWAGARAQSEQALADGPSTVIGRQARISYRVRYIATSRRIFMVEQDSGNRLLMFFAGLACAFFLVLMVVAIGSNDETPASEITPAEGEQGPDVEG
jgi:hypothetical protein